MSRSTFVLSLPPDDGRPLFERIAASLVEAIRRGRLVTGAKLPSSRALAASLEVHRNTVLAAYSELFAQGWITGDPGRGTFVSDKLPESPKRFAAPRPGVPRSAGYSLAPGGSPARLHPALAKGALTLAGGVPDVRLLPARELTRAYRRAVVANQGAALSYGFERGHPRLRAALAAMLNESRGLAADASDVLVTRGSQMAFFLAARALVTPGSVVAVEALGYSPAWSAFRSAGAEVVPVSVDGSGLVVSELAALATTRRVAAVYVTPHHQYPTMAVLSADRRLALLELARRHRFAVIEDDFDHEIHYQGRPVLPLASADAAGVVVYVGTLSKVLAPGLRAGYVVAPPPVIDHMAETRVTIDRQGDAALELAIAELLEDGVVQRHGRKMRRVYAARGERMIEVLRARFAGILSFDVPAGGLALWAKLETRAMVDVDAWQRAALARGLYFRPPAEFAVDGRARPFLRLSFSPLTEAEIDTALGRLLAAYRDVKRS